MTFFHDLVRHPRRLFVRKAFFQVHLWLGVLLSLYVAVIGFSGSILVWEDEIRAHALHGLAHAAGAQVEPQQAMTAVSARYPGETVTYLMWPRNDFPVYTVYLRNAKNSRRIVQVNASSGELLAPEHRLLVDWVHELHVYLLMGQTGFVLNCVAGISLLLLSLTGIALWWPGIRLWVRGFRMSMRHGWKRINYDLHNAVGIWTLLIVSMWSMTAIDFLFPDGTLNAVNFVFPVHNMRAPVVPRPPRGAEQATITTIAAKAHALSPGAFLSGVLFPLKQSGNVVAYMDTRTPGDYSHRDIYTFAPDGALLSTWHYGQNRSIGDWILWLVNPLHFGTLWGTPFKVLWSALGLSLPVLAITGLLMYWNRFLGRRWHDLREGP